MGHSGPCSCAQLAGCTLLGLVLQSNVFGDFQTGKVAVIQAAHAQMAAHEQGQRCLAAYPTNRLQLQLPWRMETHPLCVDFLSISSTLLSFSGSTKPLWPGGCSKLKKTVLKHFHRWSIHNHHPAPDPQWSSQDPVYLQAIENAKTCHPHKCLQLPSMCVRWEWLWGRMTLSFLLHRQEA